MDPELAATTDPEPTFAAELASTPPDLAHTITHLSDTSTILCTVAGSINLTSTIADEGHILWPEKEVVFTCETRGSILTHEWTSDDYIGDGISLSFSNLGDVAQTQSGSRSSATLVRIDYDYVMVSQLRIRTSSLFQSSSVACTSFNGTSQNITFSVLGMLH